MMGDMLVTSEYILVGTTPQNNKLTLGKVNLDTMSMEEIVYDNY
jgi:hypothetical protein